MSSRSAQIAAALGRVSLPRPGRNPRWLARAVISLAITGAALLLSLAMRSMVLPNPFILFFAAVALSAWVGGLWAGALATLVSMGVANYFLIDPTASLSLSPDAQVRSFIFVGVALLISGLSETRLQAGVQAERARERAEQIQHLLTRILERTDDGYMALDRAWRYLYINPQGARLTGHQPHELIGMRIWEIFADLRGSDLQVQLHATLDAQQPLVFEYYHPPTQRWLACRAFPAPDGTTIFMQDITTQRRATANATHVANRIAQLQALTVALTAALSPTDVAAVILDQAVRALRAQGGLVAMLTADGEALTIIDSLGYPPEIVEIGMRLPLSTPGPLVDAVSSRTPVFVESRAAAAARYPQLIDIFDQTLLHAWANIPLLVDGHVVGALEISFSTPQALEHEQAFLSTLARQCAQAMDRARLYAAEQAARAQAEEAVRQRDIFFSVAAHELRTPLTSLLGQAQVLQRRLAHEDMVSERHRHGATVVVEQAQRLNRMVAALLDISRIEQGRLSLERGLLDVAALVRRVVEESRPIYSAHSVECSTADGPLPMMGDALRLEQVVRNLLGNAVKYSAAGSVVRISVLREGQEAMITVADQGMGIPQDALDQIFRRFYRAANVSASHLTGMGVGLSVVHEIVMLHGGRVEVVSREGVGSTFIVLLPIESRE
jgi:PAS domain S-box-containing protein